MPARRALKPNFNEAGAGMADDIILEIKGLRIEALLHLFNHYFAQ